MDLSLQATAQADRGSLLIVGGLVLGFGAYALSNGASPCWSPLGLLLKGVRS